ncbi:ATP-binding cassette domain-containing protein [Paenibacillus sp. SC116]|uniref:ribosomal protection-like ABC-F family protein n=1 Tax=Paenibacillus sp. SC116 TaxID=2968986 RepID=UPI00215A35EE|nr:ABC-F family ATP-binding cassette domain-containing protein [Paenibacillus sp. SC116]MCR8842227.1 ATP-binding cassette domain-containing protein [Paenibacillus sp. SC116]
MTIVNIQEMKKYHAANLILDGLTFQIQAGEKIGLIGRNGSGKSTLLQLIAGHEPIDEGMLTIKKELRIGYLPQIPAEFEALTVYDVLAYGYRDLMLTKQEMTKIEQQMSSPEAAANSVRMEQLLEAYATMQEKFERGGGYDMDTAIEQVANGMQINRSSYERGFSSLSGGEQTRVVLASQLVVAPDLLLLDEPTNHLDLRGIEWLEQFIKRYDGACVIVSHDRYFLDAVGTKMIELEDGEAHVYHCNYSGYMKEKEERLLQQFAQYKEQQKVIKKMKETIRQLEEWGRIAGDEKFFKRAFSIRKALEKMEVVKRPVLERKAAEFDLVPLDRSGRQVILFEGLTKTFEGRAILDQAEGSLSYGEKVVLLGENGSGKTTLFKLLQGMIAPDEGQVRLGARVEVGYLAQQEPVSDSKMTVLEFFRTEGGLEEGEARGVLAKYLFYGADVYKPLQMLSGGEWSRLRLALLVRKKPNLLLLDEPTNHLDIASREALEDALDDFPGTVLAISHDRYFVNRLAKRVWEMKEGSLASYEGNYDDFKEKRAELLALEASLASNHALNIHVMPTDREKPKKPAADEKNRQVRANERRLEQLESEIAAFEWGIACVDEEMIQLNQSGDTAQLETLWRKKEELQMNLDERLEKWVELSND